MERKDKPDKIIDGNIIGLVVGIGLMWTGGERTVGSYLDGEYIRAAAEVVGTLLATGGTGIAAYRLLTKESHSSE